jgi:hypothetical protein
VRLKQYRLDELVQAIEVDVGENGTHDPPLRGLAQGGVEDPVLQVPGLEQPLHQPQEAAVVDALVQDRQKSPSLFGLVLGEESQLFRCT